MQWKHMIALCVVTTLTSCSDSTDPRSLPVCQFVGIVTVSSGTTPTFDWNPACRIGLLTVEQITGSDGWSIFGVNMTNAIAPGVTYGLVPEGAVQNAPPEPLSPGTRYHVVILVLEPEGQDENFKLVAIARFTP